METLVIGVGNEFRGDDATGRITARLLADRGLSEVTVIEQDGEGASLMAAWDGYDLVFLIDAAQSGSKPGRIQRFEAHKERIPAESLCFSSHAFGIIEAIEISRRIGQLPNRLIVYAVEGACFELDSGVSPIVHQSIDKVIEMILQEIS